MHTLQPVLTIIFATDGSISFGRGSRDSWYSQGCQHFMGHGVRLDALEKDDGLHFKASDLSAAIREAINDETLLAYAKNDEDSRTIKQLLPEYFIFNKVPRNEGFMKRLFRPKSNEVKEIVINTSVLPDSILDEIIRQAAFIIALEQEGPLEF